MDSHEQDCRLGVRLKTFDSQGVIGRRVIEVYDIATGKPVSNVMSVNLDYDPKGVVSMNLRILLTKLVLDSEYTK